MATKRPIVGLHPALVISTDDPEHSGRVLVSPVRQDPFVEVWARLATLAAGHDRGTWMMPSVGDEVLVGFTDGDVTRPYMVGSLWNGTDRQPPVASSEAQQVDRIRTAGGSVIEFDRSSGDENITIATAAGQRIELDQTSGTVTIDNGAGAQIAVGASGVEIDAPTVTVNAELVHVEAAMTTFSGIVQAPTVVATNVVAANYTPGAGNLW